MSHELARAPLYRTLSRLQWWPIAGLALIAFVALLAVTQLVRLQLLLGALEDGRPLSQLWLARLIVPVAIREGGGTADMILMMVWENLLALEVAITVIAVASAVGFYWCQFRAHRNLRALGLEPRYRAHWILTGWLVPFLNLVRPGQVMADLWRTSGADPRTGSARGPPTAMIPAWWALTLALTFGGYAIGMFLARDALERIGWVLAYELARIAAVVLLILSLRGITRMQDALAAGAPAAAPSTRQAAHPVAVFAGVLIGVLALGAGADWVASGQVERTFAALDAQRAAREQSQAKEREDAASAARSDRQVPPPPPPPPQGSSPADSELVTGADDGVEGGVEGGLIGGVPGGVVGDESRPAATGEGLAAVRVARLTRLAGAPPPYPPVARSQQVSGTVMVEVLIDEAGTVRTARALSGHPMLTGAAVAAVRGWTFEPVRAADGSATAARSIVSVGFRLSDR